MPVAYSNVYLHAAGMFLPGEPVDNAGMDAYVAPLNRLSERLKRRILAENGIVQRHYAIDAEGRTVHSNTAMAADRKSTRLNSSHSQISYAVFCLKKKK